MKSLKVISLLLAALLLVGSLTACGSKDKKDDGATSSTSAAEETTQEQVKKEAIEGWFYAEIPEGFKVSSNSDTEFVGDNGKIISVSLRKTFSDTPDAAAFAKDKADDTFKAADDLTIGKYTYKTLDFKWDGGAASKKLFADVYEGYVAEITLFCLTPDDADAKAFLESFELVEGNPDDNQQKYLQEKYSNQ
ncbi:MAG: hypothetical protein IKE65_08935 [Clostridia bacterium]|nr:hypothetical protein [Clostridia bacterium]